MRRAAVALLCVAVTLISLAPSAFAHQAGLRDPFEPLVDPQAPGTTTATTTTDTVDATTTTVDTTEEGLPTTGGDPFSWLAVAYVLVAGGASALAMARFGPVASGRAREGSSA